MRFSDFYLKVLLVNGTSQRERCWGQPRGKNGGNHWSMRSLVEDELRFVRLYRIVTHQVRR